MHPVVKIYLGAACVAMALSASFVVYWLLRADELSVLALNLVLIAGTFAIWSWRVSYEIIFAPNTAKPVRLGGFWFWIAFFSLAAALNLYCGFAQNKLLGKIIGGGDLIFVCYGLIAQLKFLKNRKSQTP